MQMKPVSICKSGKNEPKGEDAGVVGPEEGTKPRKILMTKEEFENYIEESL